MIGKYMSSSEKAWLAGFIDGEGYVGITFQKKKETKTQAASPLYHPYIIIANTNRDVLTQIISMVGCGHIYLLKKANHNQKQSYQYQLQRREQLLELLRMIEP